MKQLFDSNFEMMYDQYYDPIYTGSYGTVYPESDSENAFLRNTGLSSRKQRADVQEMYRELSNPDFNNEYFEFSNFSKLWLMPFKDSSSQYVDFIAPATSLSPSGDNSVGPLGISGDGTDHFDTGLIPSLIITSINSWSMGIYSSTDTDAGIDMGCESGANEHYVQIKAGGNAVVKNGTTSISAANSTGISHVAMSTQSGTVKL